MPFQSMETSVRMGVRMRSNKRSAAAYEEKLAAETSEFRRTMYQDALDNDRRNVSFYRQKINEAESKLAEAEAVKSGSANEKF